jgi:hypothetical protein
LPQLWLHVPQFAGSLLVSTHVLPHRVAPPEHLHEPEEQVVPPLHVCVHVPQLLLSVLVLTHAVPHCVEVGDRQVMLQLVPLQDADPLPAVGPEHGVPQTPPLPHPLPGPGLSHVPLQSSIPAGHWHPLLTHVFPPMHTCPQVPQLDGSVAKSAQPPPQGL